MIVGAQSIKRLLQAIESSFSSWNHWITNIIVGDNHGLPPITHIPTPTPPSFTVYVAAVPIVQLEDQCVNEHKLNYRLA